jgi:hypothetical protein
MAILPATKISTGELKWLEPLLGTTSGGMHSISLSTRGAILAHCTTYTLRQAHTRGRCSAVPEHAGHTGPPRAQHRRPGGAHARLGDKTSEGVCMS